MVSVIEQQRVARPFQCSHLFRTSFWTEIVRGVIIKMDRVSVSRCKSAFSLKANGKPLQPTPIFEDDWPEFCNLVDQEIKAKFEPNKIIFYRAQHGIKASAASFLSEITSKVNVLSEWIVVSQIHVAFVLEHTEGAPVFLQTRRLRDIFQLDEQPSKLTPYFTYFLGYFYVSGNSGLMRNSINVLVRIRIRTSE